MADLERLEGLSFSRRQRQSISFTSWWFSGQWFSSAEQVDFDFLS